MQSVRVIVIVSLLSLSGCSKPKITTLPDFSTPEGAVLSLEKAYAEFDMDALIEAKDFRKDAYYFLVLQFGDSVLDKVEKTATALESNFRGQIKTDGWPDYREMKSEFTDKKVLSEDEVILTERCTFADGRVVHFRIPGESWMEFSWLAMILDVVFWGLLVAMLHGVTTCMWIMLRGR